jgi:hypothetical protein
MKFFTAYNFDLLNVGSIAIIPIVIAVVQALKMTGWVKDKYAPFVSIFVGIAIAFISNHDAADLTNTILSGILFGLSASGLYSGISTTSAAIKADSKMQSSGSTVQKKIVHEEKDTVNYQHTPNKPE